MTTFRFPRRWTALGLIAALAAVAAGALAQTRTGQAASLTQGGYTTVAAAAPSSVAAGGTTTITASVTAAAAATALVDVEVYNSTSWAKVYQQAFDNQSLAAGVRKDFLVTWQVPATAVTGGYTVMVGVFAPGWGTNRHWNNAAATLTVMAAGGTATSTATSAPTGTPSAGTLPALPAGWPSTFQLGTADGPGGAAGMKATAPFGFRYQYLSGGANTGGGWATWNANGDFVTYYIQDSNANGIRPVFTYYQLAQSAPGATGGESNANYANLQNTATMTAYFKDLKLFYQKAGAFPSTMVVLHAEPDLWAFLQGRATGDNAATVPAQVAATGLPELAGLPNTVAGLAQAFIKLRNTYAPNVLVAFHVSSWATGNDFIYSNPSDATVQSLGTRVANFYTSLGAKFDLAAGDPSDRDAAFKQYQYGDGGASWWDAGDYHRYALFLSAFVKATGKRVFLWQIPLGNTKMRAQNNTWNHYQDNHVETWLDTNRTSLTELVNAGVVALLFGGGAGGVTCACDAAGDGVTNPAPINGNTGTSLNADDDGGYFRQQAKAYYQAGALTLPAGSGSGGGSGTPTATPSPSPSPTKTPTPSPSPTGTAPPVTTTITFDDRVGQDQVLSGQYPAGVIDWGTSSWWHSAPWGKFTTKSISFNGAGVTTGSFSFVSSRRLAQLDAYNGGTGATTVTVSCTGKPSKQVTLAAGQLSTITTGWTGTCTTVTITSTNGWDTNFDNLVIAAN